MNFKILSRLAGAVALTVALTGCIDVSMDIEVQSETNGKSTVTSVMGKDFYAMVKAGAASSEESSSSEGFCEEEGAVLTELDDGSASCVVVTEGTFAELDLAGENNDGATFTVQSPGVVRVGFKTDEMKSEMGAEEQDEETKAMMTAFFEGHFITIRISGNKVTDTNMTLAADGKSAEIKIPFLDLMNGTANLPPELYAVVDTN